MFGGNNMKYAKTYIDKLFNYIDEYSSKVELLGIANSNFKDNKGHSLDWVIELSTIMNWQAMSERSGVWTYYEVLDNHSAQILIDRLRDKNESEIFNKYVLGIDNFSNEELMDEIDEWIIKNEIKIYKFIEDILINNRDWFYYINDID
jgi:hypothetical protein